MKKIIAVFCALVLILTMAMVSLPVSVSAEEVTPPAGQNSSLGSTIIATASPVDETVAATKLESNFGRRMGINSISRLTNANSVRTFSYKTYGDYKNVILKNRATAMFDFPAGTTLGASGGFMFYVDIPVLYSSTDKDVPIKHALSVFMYEGTTQRRFYKLSVNQDYPWYVLPEGESQWQSVHEWDGTTGLVISDGTKPFKGYVYLPYTLINKGGGLMYEDLEATSIGVTVNTDRWSNRSGEYGAAPIEISAVSLMSSFNVNTTFAYNDKGELCDLSADTSELESLKRINWTDEVGNVITLNSAGRKPIGLADRFNIVDNTSPLPLTGLFEMSHSLMATCEKQGGTPVISFSEDVRAREYKGAVFYVKVPEITGTNFDTFRFSLYFTGYDYVRTTDDLDGDGEYDYDKNPDGTLKTKTKYFYSTFGNAWYTRSVNDNEWVQNSYSFTGIELNSGFEGYVCIPFDSIIQQANKVTEDSVITGMQFLRFTTDGTKVVADENNDGVEEVVKGYIPEDKSFVLSEPLLVEGHYAEDMDDLYDGKYFSLDGTKCSFSGGKVESYAVSDEQRAKLAAVKATAPATVLSTHDATYGVQSVIPSTSLLTDKAATLTVGSKAYANDSWDISSRAALTANFESELSWSVDSTSGFIFHVDLPKVDDFYTGAYIYVTGKDSNGAEVTKRVDSNLASTVVYTLKDNDSTGWSEHTVSGGKFTTSNTSYLPLGNNEAWSGYIFVPGSSVNDASSIAKVTQVAVYFDVNRYTTGGVLNVGDINIKTSAVSYVENFLSDNTIITTDFSTTIDLTTGEKVSLDYYSANEFEGNVESINNGTAEVLKVNTVNLDSAAVPGAVPSYISKGNGATVLSYKYADRYSPISSVPVVNVTDYLPQITRTQELYYNIDGARIDCSKNDGFMFYIKANSEQAISIGFNVGFLFTAENQSTQTSGGSAFNYSGQLKIYSIKDGTWSWTKAAEPTSGVSQLPAGFEGYVYVENFGGMRIGQEYSQGDTNYGEIRTSELREIYLYLSTRNAGYYDIDLGPIMAVESFPTATVDNVVYNSYVGLVKVNGGEVVQKMTDGSFAVPNDTNGDMSVNLIDLIRAQNGDLQKSDRVSFRQNYLSDYFTLGNETPISKSETLTALNSSQASLLEDNPDRGYRTEMVLNIVNSAIPDKSDSNSGYDPRYIYIQDMSEGEIIEALNTLFGIYLPADAEYQSKLVISFIELSGFNKTETLDQKVIDVIEMYFEYLRKYDLRALIRFSYHRETELYKSNGTEDQNKLDEICATENIMKKHIKQLSPTIGANRDVVHKISSGWIGNGEMVDNFQYTHEDAENGGINYNNVIKTVVEEMCKPFNLYFSVRMPRYKNDLGTYEYSGLIGFNNDAIFGEQSYADWHSGCFQYNHNPLTCSNGENCFNANNQNITNYIDEWEYVIKNAAYTPQSGEMFTDKGVNTPNKRIPNGLDVIKELTHHRYTAFSQWHGLLEESIDPDTNEVYDKTIQGWISGDKYTAATLDTDGLIYDPNWFTDTESYNAYEILRDHLGYKLVASDYSFNWSGKNSDFATVSLSLKNYGYAAPFTLESGFAILDENYQPVSSIKTGDPDKWYNLDPNYYASDYSGAKSESAYQDALNHTISGEISVPDKSGKYYIAFYLKNGMGSGARLSNNIFFENDYNIIGEFTK